MQTRRSKGLAAITLLVVSSLFIQALPTSAYLTSPRSSLVSFDFKDADIKDVVRAIATQTGENIVADRDVQGRITVHLRDVPFEEALKILLEANGFTYEKRGNIYQVKKLERVVEERPQTIKVVGERLTVDVKKMEITELLRRISREGRINIITDKGVAGTVDLHLDDVLLRTGLAAFLNAHGFTMTESEGIYRVSPMERGAPMLISITDGLLSVDVKDAELAEVVRRIINLDQKNLAILGEIRGKVNVSFSKLNIDEGLRLIFQGTRFTFRRDGQTYLVGDPTLTAPGAPLLTTEELIKLRYIEAKDLPRLLPPTIPPANLRVVEDQNGILVKGTDELIKEVEGFIKKIDIAPEGIAFKEGLLSVDVKDTELSRVVYWIARLSGTTLRTLSPLEGKVTIQFKDLVLDEGLRLIFEGTKFAYKRIGNTHFVGDPTLTSPAATILTEEKLIKLKHIKAKELPPLLPPTIPPANLKVVEDQNAILIKGPSGLIAEAEEVITSLDQRPAQIMIEALVVEFTRKEGEEFGLEGTYSKDKRQAAVKPGMITFKTVDTLPESFSISLAALISEGKARVRANPKVAALNGKEATIKVGWVRYFKITQFTGTPPIPYTTLQTVDAGITLKITPWVNASGEIITELHPEISDATGTGPDGLPEISRRSVDTTIRVKDGQTIIIGGLIQNTESETIERTPILSKIPLLGRLFQKKKKGLVESELVIYLTPHLLTDTEE